MAVAPTIENSAAQTCIVHTQKRMGCLGPSGQLTVVLNIPKLRAEAALSRQNVRVVGLAIVGRCCDPFEP